MRLHTHQILAAFGLLLAVLAANAQAQVNLPFGPENYSHDFQLFAPVEIDLDNEPYSRRLRLLGRLQQAGLVVQRRTRRRSAIRTSCVLAEVIYTATMREDVGTLPPPYQIHERPAERHSQCRLWLWRPLRNRLPRSRQRLDDRHPRWSDAAAKQAVRHDATLTALAAGMPPIPDYNGPISRTSSFRRSVSATCTSILKRRPATCRVSATT